MNFLGYFCLVAAAVLVVFAQQSEVGSVDPSIKLREGFFNATQKLSSSRSKILDEILAAEKIVCKNSEGARKLTQQSLVDGISIIYDAGPAYLKTLAQVLNLSNDGARQGFLSANKYIEKGVLAVLNTLKSGESLFNDGSAAGGRAAKASLNVYHLAVETGFAAIFYDVQKSANESLQALRDAQSCPIQLRIKNRNCGVAAKDDPECSDALEDINQVAKNAIRNGANPALVQELEEAMKCALDSLVQVVVDAKRVLASTKTIAETDTFAAKAMISKETEAFEEKIIQIFAQLYFEFADVCVRSENHTDNDAQSAFVVIEKANVKIIDAVKFMKQITMNGLENGGDAAMLAFETVAKSIYFAELVFIDSIVEYGKMVFILL